MEKFIAEDLQATVRYLELLDRDLLVTAAINQPMAVDFRIKIAVELETFDLERMGLITSQEAVVELASDLKGHVWPHLAKLSPRDVSGRIQEINRTMRREMKKMTFMYLPHKEASWFEQPLNGWKEVLERFPASAIDIEEMGKCYALSRYAACVFHSLQVIESGLIELGKFLKVDDPKSGWTAVANKLRKIVKSEHKTRTRSEKKHFAFIEQTEASVEALKNAWRNKISHSQGRLAVMTAGEFSPDVAVEIMMATRAFMRRLATEMPR